MRQEMENLGTKAAQQKFGRESGLATTAPLVKISPALNIILTRPVDPAHSEYSGQSKLMHEFLLDSVVTGPAARLYGETLRHFPFPSGWPRLQSPLHHLKSYSLSDHARWSCIIPGLLRCWLQETHLQPHLLRTLKGKSLCPLTTIINAFRAVAISNSITMSTPISALHRENFRAIVEDARMQYQRLLQIAATAAETNPALSRVGSRAGTPFQPMVQSRFMPPPPLRSGFTASSEPMTKKGARHHQDQKRPNVHTGLHLPPMLEEYGLTVLLNVLIGEDMHRLFKKLVYNTNHSNVERQLLLQENLRQTIRLILLNAYKESELPLTRMIQELHDRCPTLFENLLTKSEQERLIEDEDEDDMWIQADDIHRRPYVTGCLATSYVQDVLYLPTRSSDTALPREFARLLRDAYSNDYAMPNIHQFGKARIQWAKKFSFSDRFFM
jgi:hypothetical protein